MCLGIPGRILDIEEGALRFGRVAFGDLVKSVSLALVPEAEPGHFVIVHAGTALEILDEEEARLTLEMLRQLEVGEP